MADPTTDLMKFHAQKYIYKNKETKCGMYTLSFHIQLSSKTWNYSKILKEVNNYKMEQNKCHYVHFNFSANIKKVVCTAHDFLQIISS